MSFATDASILTKVKSLLKKANSATIPTAISAHITSYNTKAYNDIIAALMARGYSAGDVSDWDRGEEFNIDLACWWAINDAGVTEQFDDRDLAKLDRRAELLTCAITVGGALVSITPVTTTNDYSTNKSYGNKFAFGTGLDYTNFKQKPDKYKPTRITEFGE